jgi:hypothetical protein
MISVVVLSIVMLSVVAWPASVQAQKQRNVSDIATCNKDAEAAAGTPSALPRPPQPPALPDAPKVPAPAAGGLTGGTTDPTGQLITHPLDPLLEGMAAARADDAAFRVAYRDCMQRLGY